MRKLRAKSLLTPKRTVVEVFHVTTHAVEAWLDNYRREVDAALERFLPPEPSEPNVLFQAMRYSITAGGKRIRPVLLLTTAEGLCDPLSEHAPSADVIPPREALLKAACSLELIHTYSLIHDDLPALDNDDLRRGKPTNHKMFGEAIAIMVGDALQSLAFSWMAEIASLGVPVERTLEAVSLLARAAGPFGMVGGQVFDLEGEGKNSSMADLERIHRLKTGAMLAVSVEIGAVLAGADSEECPLLREFGRKIGLLFQIVDDILDVVSDASTLGKTPGKDQKLGKATYPALLGIDESRRLATEVEKEALELLSRLRHPIPRLAEIARFILTRLS
ncbi:MAG: polyprenyl synthetase family protein [Candidatus Riflebacteria bacterium]|nr:polyprenyl synthetase family protein [Candidatus Riflebacteria bacterium]